MFLIRSLNRGGAERQLVALATGLHQRGWPVAVACFYAGGVFEADLVRSGVSVIDLKKRGRWDVVGFLWRLLRVYRAFHPEVVHGYMPMANMLALLARIVQRRTRVVWGVRASNIDLRQYDWLSTVAFRASGWLSRAADCVVANSHAGAAYHVARGYPAKRMRVIPNGIDMNRFRFDPAGRNRVRTEWGVTGEQVLVGLVGRLDPMKDHPTFLRAAALLSQRNAKWRFVFVGGGPDKYAARLRALANDLGLGERLVWAAARGDMAAVYSAMDIASSSSRGEGFSNVVAEAMACGVPCVVTDVGDSARIVGDLGVVVPARDPAVLAAGLERMLAAAKTDGAPARASRCGRIGANFSVDALVDRTASLLLAVNPVRHASSSVEARE